MGFFDTLKSVVGIGNPKIAFNVTTDRIRRGTAITGTVTLTGGSRETPVKNITVEHIEILSRREWSSTTNSYVERKTETVVNREVFDKDGYLLKPGETITENFELLVSELAMCTGYPYEHKLKVSADVPGLDPAKSIKILII